MFSKIFQSLDRIANGVDSINKNLGKHTTVDRLSFLISNNQKVKIYYMTNALGVYRDICVWRGIFKDIPFEYLKEEIYKMTAQEDGSLAFVLNIDYDKK